MQTLHMFHLRMPILRINLERIQYNAVLAITGTIRRITRDKFIGN